MGKPHTLVRSYPFGNPTATTLSRIQERGLLALIADVPVIGLPIQDPQVIPKIREVSSLPQEVYLPVHPVRDV